MPLRTEENIAAIKGVGEARRSLLAKLSINTVGDMLLHIPTRFLDRRMVTPVVDLRPGADAVVRGRIVSVSRRRKSRGPAVTAILSDDTGSISLTFFRGGFPSNRLTQGLEVIACGEIQSYRGYNIVHPDLYFGEDDSIAADLPGMLPVYRLTAGLNQGFMRSIARSVLDQVKNSLDEILPGKVLEAEGFSTRWEMFSGAHCPDSPDMAERARDLIALEELFLHRSVLSAVRKKGESLKGVRIEGITPDRFQEKLPWPLTEPQRRTCCEIQSDLISGNPMRRLLQGDVGSGKTVVAAYGCIATGLSGRTSAVLAPTEVLAHQHHINMRKFAHQFGLKVHLLTGGTSKSQRIKLAENLRNDPSAILIGTHAILEDWVPLNAMSFLVIDEQHRFGVAQREKLLGDASPRPHALVMSATPIPRTLAMTFYGDLDLSILDSMPPGRGRTETSIVAADKKAQVFRFMLGRLEKGERVFMVYPLREASEKTDIMDATTAFDIVSSGTASRYGAGLLHGNMPPAEKVDVTSRFARGEIGVLVSTTVIEVGIDVPEATVMIVVNAERFGLSQLHQLRGRIGRGGRDAWCFLVPGDNPSMESMARLEILASTSDGFQVAEKDLKNRGPGNVLGTAQHGIPEFRVADLARDELLVRKVNGLKAMSLEKVQKIMKHQMWRYGNLVLPGV